MRFRDRLENARRYYDMHDLVGSRKKVMVCPLPSHIHSNNTPSFSIFFRDGYQFFACHGNCQAKGDVVDLIGYMNMIDYNPYDHTKKRRALEILEGKQTVEMPVIAPKQANLMPDIWQKFLPPGEEAVAYAHKRGLNDATIQKFKLGQKDNFLTMPCFEEYNLVGLKMRNLTSDGTRFLQTKGSRQGLFNMDSIQYKAGPVFLTKGEIPCMLLDQLGFAVCAPTGGEGGWRESWRTALALATSIIVIGDNDSVGREMGKRRAQTLDAKLVFPPEQYKDWDEFYLADPDECIRLTKSWEEQ